MLLWLLACQSPADCKDGFTAGADGLCYEDAAEPVEDDTGGPGDAPPTVEDVLAALPPCEPVATDARIDLYAGCADGVCPFMTYTEVVDALGEEPDCYGFYYEFDGYEGGSVSCTSSTGIETDFDDADRDGVPDPGSYTFGIGLNEGYTGGTDSGIGIGATMACLVEELGSPTSISFSAETAEWVLDYAYWAWAGVSVQDRVDGRGDWYPDGYVDQFSLYGAEGEL